MRLSTTVNFFIAPYMQDQNACVQAIRQYKQLGFSCLDAIFCSAGAVGSPLRENNWESWVSSLAEAAQKEGVTFVQSHVPFYNFCTLPAGTPGDMEMIVDRSILSAAILGAKWTVAHPATALGAPLSFPASKQANMAYFSKRLEVCAKCGTGLAIENMADFEGGGRNRWYCAYAEELCDLVDSLNQGSGLVGVCWDFGHANLVYKDQTQALRLVGERLKVTHVHDNNGERDEHISPFRGTVEWFDIMDTLAQMGYAHDFSFEVRRILRGDVPDEIKNSIWRHLLLVGDFLLERYNQTLLRQPKR